MARPRAFDTDLALEKAKDVFWELGYAEATLPMLLEGMNLTRGSLYKAFTDKQTLFVQVLDIYDQREVTDAVAVLTGSQGTGRARILALFAQIVDAVAGGDRRGCLLCSAIAGPAIHDAEIAQRTTRSVARLQEAFEEALGASAPRGHVGPLARLLVTQYVGLRIQSCSPTPVSEIRQSVAGLGLLLPQ